MAGSLLPLCMVSLHGLCLLLLLTSWASFSAAQEQQGWEHLGHLGGTNPLSHLLSSWELLQVVAEWVGLPPMPFPTPASCSGL